MLPLLILGPNNLVNDIDVYLQPLIDDLKELWKVSNKTYNDSSSHNFQLHATLLWNVIGFPTYGMLYGWSTKWALDYSCCNKETISRNLKYSFKQCYMGHHRFLPTNHLWCNNNNSFDNTREVRHASKSLTEDNVMAQHEYIKWVIFGKTIRKQKRNIGEKHNWKKKIIYFFNCLIGGFYY